MGQSNILTADQARLIQEDFVVQTRGIVALEKLIRERAAKGYKYLITGKMDYLLYYFDKNLFGDRKIVTYWKREPFYTDNDIEILKGRGFTVSSTPAYGKNTVEEIEKFIKKWKWFNSERKNRDAQEALDILKAFPDTHMISWD